MKTNFIINHLDNTIEGSKTAFKKAGQFGTPEYKELTKLKNLNPGFRCAEKEIKKSSNKKTYKGLNKKFMEDYIKSLNSSEDLKDFETVKKDAYPLVKSWFLDKYSDFNMSRARKQVSEFNKNAYKQRIIKLKIAPEESSKSA